MLAELGSVQLKNGEEMHVRRLTPPAPEHADHLLHFLDHKADAALRGIRARLAGRYASFFTDKYFLAEIGGRLAGQLWYGYAERGAGIANFGHVYTDPEHRGKGVVNRLMDFFIADFRAAPVRAVLCTAGQPWVARIYVQRGFQPVMPGTDCGPLILLQSGLAADFAEYEKMYFAPGRPVDMVAAGMAYRHDADLMLHNALRLRGCVPQRLGGAFAVKNYQDACFRAEDGAGILMVAITADRHVMGWSFALAAGAPAERSAPVLDYEIHPVYGDAAAGLARETVRAARVAGLRNIYAYAAASDAAKIAALHAAGFRTAARLPAYLELTGAPADLMIMHV